ncbi:MAG: hypothetical protein HC836_33795 [Richelia sp. RM2_1_2]|nr:hypothetical protein [Richelia sp. RM2_1_2]
MNSKLITPESPLLVPPLLAAEIGLNEALILQQIHYYCLMSKHIKRDGRRWFWKTLSDWSKTLPFLSTSTIRRAIANLKDKFNLIDVERHSQKTWYQANWFTINVENVETLWNKIFHSGQMDVTNLNTSSCSRRTDDIKEFSSADFSSEKQAAEKEKCLEPDWDKVEQLVNQWEQEQLTGEPTNKEQPAVTSSVDDNSQDLPTNELSYREDASPPSDGDELSFPNSDRVHNLSSKELPSREDASPLPQNKQGDRPLRENQNLSSKELRPSVDTTPPPDNEREEENIKLCEVRSTVGKLTPRLKKLIAEHTLGDLRKALALYRDRCSKQQIRDAEGWLKKCLQQRWWQDKSTSHTSTDARQDNLEPKRATEKLTPEQKAWYESAIAQGICLPAAIEELPIRMGSVCARVIITNRRPFDPPFEVLPIEKLMVQYPIGAAAEVES